MSIQSVTSGNRNQAVQFQSSRTVNQERINIPPISQVSSERSIKVMEQKTNPQLLTISEQELLRVIETAAKAFQGPMTSLEMSVHEGTNEVIIRVKDKETGELIREIPPEKILDIKMKMKEIAGILFDEKV